MRRSLVIGTTLGAAVAAVTLLAGPPLAEAQQAEPLQCNIATPTFYPRGDHWAAAPSGSGPAAVSYRISDLAPGGIALATAQGAIEEAMDTWMAVTCAASCTEVDNCAAGQAQPNVRVTRGADYPGRDGGDAIDYQNIVYFVDSGWSSHAGDGIYWDPAILAMTSNYYTTGSFYLVHSDMAINDEDFAWRVGASGCDPATSTSCFDLETVALHEFGHFLGFNHVNCTDSVMYPTGNSALVRQALTDHEETGLCAVYPPRPIDVACTDGAPHDDCLTFGEQCALNDTKCCDPCTIDNGPSECIYEPGIPDKWGKCSRRCTTTSQCPYAHTCESRTANNGTAVRICLPGPNFVGNEWVTGTCECDVSAACDPDLDNTAINCACDYDCTVTEDPTGGGTGTLDHCSPCISGDQCLSGVCVGTEAGDGICTEACLPEADCGPGWDCLSTDAGWSVCWPESSATCGSGGTIGGQLNELCYLEDPEWYNPCGADLICFGFQPRCLGQWGTCVNYCNSSDWDCPDGLDCCYGVDDNGNCIKTPPTGNSDPGGCFNLRREGESCVLSENAICHDNMECAFFTGGDSSLAECYRRCEVDLTCAAGSTCYTFPEYDQYGEECGSSISLCCDDEGVDTYDTCLPGASPTHFEIGVECTFNEDCDSGLCLHFDNGSACSRGCRPGAGNGCPGEADDVNNDGIPDGGFTCRVIEGEGYCWPDEGPLADPSELLAVKCAADAEFEGCDDHMAEYCSDYPSSTECEEYCAVAVEAEVCDEEQIPVPGCEGCSFTRPGDFAVSALPFVLIAGWRWRRRRRSR